MCQIQCDPNVGIYCPELVQGEENVEWLIPTASPTAIPSAIPSDAPTEHIYSEYLNKGMHPLCATCSPRLNFEFLEIVLMLQLVLNKYVYFFYHHI